MIPSLDDRGEGRMWYSECVAKDISTWPVVIWSYPIKMAHLNLDSLSDQPQFMHELNIPYESFPGVAPVTWFQVSQELPPSFLEGPFPNFHLTLGLRLERAWGEVQWPNLFYMYIITSVHQCRVHQHIELCLSLIVTETTHCFFILRQS